MHILSWDFAWISYILNKHFVYFSEQYKFMTYYDLSIVFKSKFLSLAILAADHHKICFCSKSLSTIQMRSRSSGFCFKSLSNSLSILFETGWLKARSFCTLLRSLVRTNFDTYPCPREVCLRKTVSTERKKIYWNLSLGHLLIMIYIVRLLELCLGVLRKKNLSLLFTNTLKFCSL